MPTGRYHLCWAVALLVFVASLAFTATSHAGGYRPVDPPRALGDVSLVTKHVENSQVSLAGHWTFLSLGFTHCPDICPTVLSNLAAVRQKMLDNLAPAAIPKMLFVSVDPNRDSPAYLAEYVANFGDGFVAATGSKAAIDGLVRKLGAFYRLGRKDKDGFYNVDHSAEIYLIDPKARLRARFRPPLDPKQTLADFLALSETSPGPRADREGKPIK